MNPTRQSPPEGFGSLRHAVLGGLAQVLEDEVPSARTGHDGRGDHPPDLVDGAVALAMAEPLEESPLLRAIPGNSLLQSFPAALALCLDPGEGLKINLDLRSLRVGGEEGYTRQV
jgi:hypothetical protein